MRNSNDTNASHQYKEVNARLSTLLTQEDAFWRQQSNVHWLRDGDTNSKFFHAMASATQWCNLTSSLTHDDGKVADSQMDLNSVAHAYVTNLFEEGFGNYEPVINYCLDPKITGLDNDTLLAPFDIGEFKNALFSMHCDGLNPAFFERFWNLCGPELFHS